MSSPALSGCAIGFRRLREADLLLLHAWINRPHVLRWWAERGESGFTGGEVARKYGPRIRGEEPTEPYLVLVDGRPAGYLQWYRLRDHPDYLRHLQIEGEEAAGMDFFLGEPELTGRGLGPRLLRAFLEEVVFAAPGITHCVVGPAASNHGSIRACEKAGFRHLKTVQVPGEREPERLLEVTPAELAGT